jgi:hypothetical protein
MFTLLITGKLVAQSHYLIETSHIRMYLLPLNTEEDRKLLRVEFA